MTPSRPRISDVTIYDVDQFLEWADTDDYGRGGIEEFAYEHFSDFVAWLKLEYPNDPLWRFAANRPDQLATYLVEIGERELPGCRMSYVWREAK